MITFKNEEIESTLAEKKIKTTTSTDPLNKKDSRKKNVLSKRISNKRLIKMKINKIENKHNKRLERKCKRKVD